MLVFDVFERIAKALRTLGLRRQPMLWSLLLLLGAQPALAQQEIRYPQLLEHGGKQFAAYVNEITGVPSWIIDPDSLDFTLGASLYLSSEASVRTAADAFVEAHKNVFGLDPKQLGAPRITGDSQWWFVSYPQLHGGYRVLGAEIGLTVTRGGALIATGATGFPKLEVDASPSLGSSAAIAAARGNTIAPNLQADVKDELVIVPEEVGDTYAFHLAWEVILYNYENDPPFSKTFIVDAHTGKILHEYSNILESGGGSRRHAAADSARTNDAGTRSQVVPAWDGMPSGISVRVKEKNKTERLPIDCSSGTGAAHNISGTIRLNYYESPNDSAHGFFRFEDKPFSGAKFSVKNSAGGLVCTGYAGEDGTYSVSVSEAGSYEVTFEIANDRATVNVGSKECQKEKSFTVNVNGAARLDYDWGWGDGGDGEMTSYALNGAYQVRRMYKYFRDTFSFTGLDSAMFEITISAEKEARTFSGLNIMYLGGMHAMSSDAAMHEYTHNVLYKLAGLGHKKDSMKYAMGEGFSDYFTTDHTDHEQMGGPLAGNNDRLEWVRSSSATTRFVYNTCTMDYFSDVESDCGKESDSIPKNRRWHRPGKIISGAIWRIRQRLGGEASRLLFTAMNMGPEINNFEELRDRYHRVDNGANAAVIEEKFVDRKIGGPLMPGWPSISLTDSRNPQIRWTDQSFLEDGYLVESSLKGGIGRCLSGWEAMKQSTWIQASSVRAGTRGITITG